jgi:chlorite dismutase
MATAGQYASKGWNSMSEPNQTLEGWYVLHDFRTIDWTSWKYVPAEERAHCLDQLLSQYGQWKQTEADKRGCTVVYNIAGHKADVMFLHFRESLEQLNAIKTAFNKTDFAHHTVPVYSYVSIVELGAYMVKPGTDPMEDPEIVARLHPILPPTEHICFYPMNKKRDGQDNWYMLSIEERRNFMRDHGMIGRRYAGRVKQIITGSTGLDDWEWGVTLLADDALTFKKLIYEMRFDETSARFAEFGEFYVGTRMDEHKLAELLAL